MSKVLWPLEFLYVLNTSFLFTSRKSPLLHSLFEWFIFVNTIVNKEVLVDLKVRIFPL